MISVPTNDQHSTLNILASIARFSTLPETRGMRDWLKEELVRLHVANQNEMDDVTYRQRQGACQTLSKILEIAETADKTAEKIRANQSKR